MENQVPQPGDSKPKISASTQKPSIMKELINYSVTNVIEPKSKEIVSNLLTGVIGMFSEAANKSVDKWIYPEGSPRTNNTNRNSTGGVYVPSTNYTVYSTKSTPAQQKQKEQSINKRSSTQVNYIWVETSKQAQEIISTLKEDIDNYKKASVARLYEMLVDENGKQLIATVFTDFTHGWTEEHLPMMSYYQETTGPNRGKYFIDLPKPVNIENVN